MDRSRDQKGSMGIDQKPNIMQILESKSPRELEQVIREAQKWIEQRREEAREALREDQHLRFMLYYIPKILEQMHKEIDSGARAPTGDLRGAQQGQPYRQHQRQPPSQPPPPQLPYPDPMHQAMYPGYQMYPPMYQGYPQPPPGYPGQYMPPPPGYGMPQYYQAPPMQDDIQRILAMPPEEIARLPEQQRQRVMQIRAQHGR